MKRILVVDDEPSVLLGICRALRGRRDDWEAVLALDAQEACERLDLGSDIAAVVCDLSMPGGGGEAVLRHAQDKYPAVARIILSGNLKTETGDRCRTLAHRALEKPCSMEVLRSVVEELTTTAAPR